MCNSFGLWAHQEDVWRSPYADGDHRFHCLQSKENEFGLPHLTCKLVNNMYSPCLSCVGVAGLDTVLQVGYHKSRVEGENHLLQPWLLLWIFLCSLGAVAFLGCRYALSLPPTPYVQLTQSTTCSGFSRFAKTLLCDLQLMLCIALADSTPNSQLILLSLLGITPWVYEGVMARQFITKVQYPIIVPVVSETMVHNCWKDSELHLITLGENQFKDCKQSTCGIVLINIQNDNHKAQPMPEKQMSIQIFCGKHFPHLIYP